MKEITDLKNVSDFRLPSITNAYLADIMKKFRAAKERQKGLTEEVYGLYRDVEVKKLETNIGNLRIKIDAFSGVIDNFSE
jgi:hypothetical protein